MSSVWSTRATTTAALFGAAFLTSGCVADPWPDVRATCGFQGDQTLELSALYQAPDGGWNGLTVSTDCSVALIESVGGNAAALLRDVNGAADWGTHIEEARLGTRPLDGVTVAVWGLLWLLGGDYGQVGALEAGPYVAESWVSHLTERAEQLGLDDTAPLGRLMLADITERSAGLQFLRDDAPSNSAMAMEGWPADRLRVPRGYDQDNLRAGELPHWQPNWAASGLFHEAQHASLDGKPHVECASPATTTGRFCDPDLGGAYGATYLAEWAEVQVALHGSDCVPSDNPLVHDLAFTAEHHIRVSWEHQLMAPLPEPLVLLACE